MFPPVLGIFSAGESGPVILVTTVDDICSKEPIIRRLDERDLDWIILVGKHNLGTNGCLLGTGDVI